MAFALTNAHGNRIELHAEAVVAPTMPVATNQTACCAPPTASATACCAPPAAVHVTCDPAQLAASRDPKVKRQANRSPVTPSPLPLAAVRWSAGLQRPGATKL